MTNQSTASQLMDIALRIREMREILGYSIQEMAELSMQLLTNPLFSGKMEDI